MVGCYTAKHNWNILCPLMWLALLVTLWNIIIYFLTCLLSVSTKCKFCEGGNFFYLTYIFLILVLVRVPGTCQAPSDEYCSSIYRVIVLFSFLPLFLFPFSTSIWVSVFLSSFLIFLSCTFLLFFLSNNFITFHSLKYYVSPSSS